MSSLRDRARASLRVAMRERDRESVAAVRGLLSAFDNAGAVPHEMRAGAMEQAVGLGRAEAERRDLTEADLTALALEEIREHRAAAEAAAARADAVTAASLQRQASCIEALLD